MRTMNKPLVREKRSKLGYRALDSELREIRILSIRSNSSLGIECSLEHASLLTCPPYKALSYTWGDPADTTDILLNGCSFPVTRNFATALQHIRSFTETVSFWIDAILCDSHDTQERSEQVQYMKAIYEHAQEVIIWLGPDRNDGVFAIEAMNMVSDSQIILGSKSGNPPGFVPPTISDRFFKTRVWVIQEATFPNETYFMCGRYKTEFTRVTITVIQILYSRILQALRPGSETPDLVRFQKVISLYSIRQGRINQDGDLDLLHFSTNHEYAKHPT
ncbi:uncharacterized protein K444DRAFT_605729 [Hyaloscypha bicolor E]|uniref:Heterokaryon incompatibility domain-containing protein n=1 Tax=Hyaloscypha bicolor E TaxID=1095630 RepID=A0A2J6SFF0_9HELO|nr:uncharacterized protein K444DRAFT_605729 [Hyaloscypha bicolor E]PMD49501.1 hypothetical protein K444DRAFT_605729 [Hyaloscypha bicolor E]